MREWLLCPVAEMRGGGYDLQCDGEFVAHLDTDTLTEHAFAQFIVDACNAAEARNAAHKYWPPPHADAESGYDRAMLHES